MMVDLGVGGAGSLREFVSCCVFVVARAFRANRFFIRCAINSDGRK